MPKCCRFSSKNKRQLIPVKGRWAKVLYCSAFAMPAVVTIIYGLVMNGLTFRACWPFLCFLFTYVYGRFALPVLGEINYQLFLVAGISLLLKFLLWPPSEYNPFAPSNTEGFPHLAGTTFGAVIASSVILHIASNDNKTLDRWWQLPLLVLHLRHYWVPFSIVVATGYGGFLSYSYALHLVFVDGMYPLVLLALVSITFVLVVAHQQAKKTLSRNE